MVLVGDKGRYGHEVVDVVQTESWNEYLSSYYGLQSFYAIFQASLAVYCLSFCLAIISPGRPAFPPFFMCFLRILLMNLSGRGISPLTHSL